MITYEIDPQLKNRKIEELVTLPKVITVNAFTEVSAKEFRKEFNDAIATGQKVIPIEIDSYGGQVYALTSMMETIAASPVPVATIATGKAMSCGAMLLSCGTEGMRYIRPYSTVMIHEVSSFAFGKLEEIKADVKEAARLNKFLFREMAKNCGKNRNYFIDIVAERKNADWFLDAEDVVKHNLANKIGSFSMKVTISAKVEIV